MFVYFLSFAALISLALAQAPVVPVKPFTPTPIHITLADLPAPFATPSVGKPAIVVPIPSDATLSVPDSNFRITVYRDRLSSPRQMIYTPTGEILLTQSSGNIISILSDDTIATFADASNGISRAFGMAFIEGWFYVANAGNLRRYQYTTGEKRLRGTGQVLMTYGSTGHWTRSLIISPDHKHVFVTVGSVSNVDAEYPSRASVQIANIDGSNIETFASGLRNPVGIDFHPKTGDLYVAVQERDAIGDDLVPDYFTRIQKDQFYGWPFAYLSSENVEPRRRFPNGTSERPDLVAQTVTPDVLFESHSAVLGMQFYRGTQFPTKYQNGAFAAFHGSWNRNAGTGYKVVFIPFGDDNRPNGYYEDFIKGFLLNPQGPTTWGRPVGILEMKDGSLLVSDDGHGRLYRIEYVESNSPRQVTTSTTPKGPATAILVSSAPTISIHLGFFICLILALLR